ncbi:hypothetical protein BS17DRAFT_782343 [Gyrodon lividus]|nr:hypothetical protein BS17DRAFT_782343 [Gyrodon lividus]
MASGSSWRGSCTQNYWPYFLSWSFPAERLWHSISLRSELLVSLCSALFGIERIGTLTSALRMPINLSHAITGSSSDP